MPTGYSSQAGHAILRTQAVQGTYQADTATAGMAIRLTSGHLDPSRQMMIPTPEIGGSRDVPDALLGPSIWEGTYSFYARMNSLMQLMYGALGIAGTPATTTGVTTQTITPSDAAQLPFFSIEEEIGANLDTYKYTDAAINNLHIEAAADGYLMGSADIIALNQVDGVTPSDVSTITDSTPLVVGTNVSLTYNGVSISAKNFKVDIKNNFENNDFRLGSFYAASLVPKRREITGSFNFRPTDSSLFKQAVYGSSTATSAGGLMTKNPLVITMSTYEIIPGGTPATVRSLTLTMPKVGFQPFGLPANADDIITTDINFQAFRPSNATAVATAVFKTDLTTIP